VAAAKNDPALRAGNNRRQPKAAAVKTFENKHRPNSGRTEAAAKRGRASREAAVRHHSGAGNGTTAEKRSGAAGRGETGKPTNRVARTAHGAHAPVKASRNEHVARSHAGNATHARHSESRKVTNASHAVHHPQAAVHHQRVASHSRHVAPHHQRVASYHRQGSLHGRRMTSHARHTAPSRDHARTAKAGKNKGKKHGGHG
jgi:hypothetical protein